MLAIDRFLPLILLLLGIIGCTGSGSSTVISTSAIAPEEHLQSIGRTMKNLI